MCERSNTKVFISSKLWRNDMLQAQRSHSLTDMHYSHLIIYFNVVLCLNFSFGQNGGGNGKRRRNKPLENLVPDNYSLYQSPAILTTNRKVSEPARVVCSILPLFVTHLSMQEMDFTVDLDIRIEWLDHRLNLPAVDVVGRSSKSIPSDIFEKLWQPQMMFLNRKGSEALVIPHDSDHGAVTTKTAFSKDNNDVIALRVAYRTEFNFRCDLNFEAYPFDLQHCEIFFQLHHDIKDDIHLLMTAVTVEHWKSISVPPGFCLDHFELIHCDNKEGPAGKKTTYYIRYKYVFAFQRIYAQHIMLIYVPSVLIVTLSWISFWLDVKNAAPRIALGLTTLLTLSTQFNNAQKGLPAVAEIKALDIWMFACMFMVFASLLEYSVVVFCESRQATLAELPRRIIPFKKGRKKELPYGWTDSQRHNTNSKCTCCVVPASRIDSIARFTFPLAFVLFNFGYWSYFFYDAENRFSKGVHC